MFLDAFVTISVILLFRGDTCPPPTFKETAMTDEASAPGEARNYEECLAEIQALRNAPSNDGWTQKRQSNKGPKVTREMFQVSDDALDAWIEKNNRVFGNKPMSMREPE
jgi:hypothetical protein